MKVAMQLIKKSLLIKISWKWREHAFAFRALEIFFNENPIFLSEIENIDTVRNALIRKELFGWWRFSSIYFYRIIAMHDSWSKKASRGSWKYY